MLALLLVKQSDSFVSISIVCVKRFDSFIFILLYNTDSFIMFKLWTSQIFDFDQIGDNIIIAEAATRGVLLLHFFARNFRS